MKEKRKEKDWPTEHSLISIHLDPQRKQTKRRKNSRLLLHDQKIQYLFPLLHNRCQNQETKFRSEKQFVFDIIHYKWKLKPSFYILVFKYCSKAYVIRCIAILSGFYFIFYWNKTQFEQPWRKIERENTGLTSSGTKKNPWICGENIAQLRILNREYARDHRIIPHPNPPCTCLHFRKDNPYLPFSTAKLTLLRKQYAEKEKRKGKDCPTEHTNPQNTPSSQSTLTP